MEIEDLLKSMLTLKKESKESRILENSKETWERIRNGSWADNLNFDSTSEKKQWLKEWISNNEYSAI